MPTLVDTNTIIDVTMDDPAWGAWADAAIRNQGPGETFINPIIFAELSAGAKNIHVVEEIMLHLGLQLQEIPKPALFLTGQIFRKYRSQGGTKTSPLPDFFIGAHAKTFGYSILTRDVKRYQTYFPEVPLITP